MYPKTLEALQEEWFVLQARFVEAQEHLESVRGRPVFDRMAIADAELLVELLGSEVEKLREAISDRLASH